MHEHVRGTQRVRACLQVHCQTRLDAKRRELIAQVFVSGVQPKLCAAKRMIALGVLGQRAPGTRTRTVVCPTPCRCAGELPTTIRDLKLWAYRPRVNKEVTSTERGAAFKAFSLRSRSGMFAIQFFFDGPVKLRLPPPLLLPVFVDGAQTHRGCARKSTGRLNAARTVPQAAGPGQGAKFVLRSSGPKHQEPRPCSDR